jgi:hypothetical protein
MEYDGYNHLISPKLGMIISYYIPMMDIMAQIWDIMMDNWDIIIPNLVKQ